MSSRNRNNTQSVACDKPESTIDRNKESKLAKGHSTKDDVERKRESPSNNVQMQAADSQKETAVDATALKLHFRHKQLISAIMKRAFKPENQKSFAAALTEFCPTKVIRSPTESLGQIDQGDTHCLCGAKIKTGCKLVNTMSKKVYVVGATCMKRFVRAHWSPEVCSNYDRMFEAFKQSNAVDAVRSGEKARCRLTCFECGIHGFMVTSDNIDQQLCRQCQDGVCAHCKVCWTRYKTSDPRGLCEHCVCRTCQQCTKSYFASLNAPTCSQVLCEACRQRQCANLHCGRTFAISLPTSPLHCPDCTGRGCAQCSQLFLVRRDDNAMFCEACARQITCQKCSKQFAERRRPDRVFCDTCAAARCDLCGRACERFTPSDSTTCSACLRSAKRCRDCLKPFEPPEQSHTRCIPCHIKNRPELTLGQRQNIQQFFSKHLNSNNRNQSTLQSLFDYWQEHDTLTVNQMKLLVRLA